MPQYVDFSTLQLQTDLPATRLIQHIREGRIPVVRHLGELKFDLEATKPVAVDPRTLNGELDALGGIQVKPPLPLLDPLPIQNEEEPSILKDLGLLVRGGGARRAPRSSLTLTPEEVVQIRERAAAGDEYEIIGIQFGLSGSTVSDLALHTTRRDVAGGPVTCKHLKKGRLEAARRAVEGGELLEFVAARMGYPAEKLQKALAR